MDPVVEEVLSTSEANETDDALTVRQQCDPNLERNKQSGN